MFALDYSKKSTLCQGFSSQKNERAHWIDEYDRRWRPRTRFASRKGVRELDHFFPRRNHCSSGNCCSLRARFTWNRNNRANFSANRGNRTSPIGNDLRLATTIHSPRSYRDVQGSQGSAKNDLQAQPERQKILSKHSRIMASILGGCEFVPGFNGRIMEGCRS